MRIGHRFAVKVQKLGRSKNYGCAIFQDAVVRKGFNNYLWSNTVNVAARNTDDRFVHSANMKKELEWMANRQLRVQRTQVIAEKHEAALPSFDEPCYPL